MKRETMKQLIRPWGTVLLAAIFLAAVATSAAERGVMLGKQIQEFSLQDFRGRTHSLAEHAEAPVVVVYFMGTECPLAKLYAPRMQSLANRFAEQQVVFLGINSNVQDSITELSSYARLHRVRFPILKDVGNRVADQFGATRTPQVFVLDAQRKIRYLGRIDSQYSFGSGVGLAKPQPAREDLAVAIEQVLAGKQVSIPVTKAVGCLIGRVARPNEKSEVTYSQQISRLVQRRCLECHRPGQIAPFAMTSYQQVAGWGEMIREVVQQQRMPPWHASSEHGKFRNENRLTAKEIGLVETWVANGCPEGDPKQLPKPKTFTDAWFLQQQPDALVYMTPRPVPVKSEGVESYRRYTVDPGFTEDKWVRIAECRPGNRAVVHHIIVYVLPPGGEKSEPSGRKRFPRRIFLAGFAPGTRPLQTPEGWAKRVPAGSRLMFEMHYTPIGSRQVDRSAVALVFAHEKDVTHELHTAGAINSRFVIPAHDPHYRVESEDVLRSDVEMISLYPHMHMRGKSFRYEVTYPDGKKEVLLDVPRFDFNWQNSYIFQAPKQIPRGSRLRCTAVYDNSAANLANPDPARTIRWGQQTWDEMMIGYYDFGVPRKVTGKPTSSGSGPDRNPVD